MEILEDGEGVEAESSKCSTKLLSGVCECEEEEGVEVEHWRNGLYMPGDEDDGTARRRRY